MNFKKITTVLLVLSFIAGKAQTTRYYIQLTDKNNTPYSINNPSQFLTQRAIDRRTNQGIAINETDLPVDPSYISQIIAKGVTFLYPVKWFNGVVIETNDPAKLDTLATLPFVVSNAPLNKSLPSKTFEKENISIASSQKTEGTNSTYNYGNSLNQIQMLNGVCMHDLGFNGTGMMIAVIDAGFANADTHPAFDSLRAHNQILGTKDFTFNAPLDLYNSSTSGHGTNVLGTMGGNWPGQLVGTAPKASYWLIRSEYAPTENLVEEYNWAAAAAYADSVGADIINSSLGYSTFDNSSENHTPSELDGNTSIASRAARMCARKGMIACISAGNSGGTSWPTIGFPADADSILTVGAVDSNGNYANFSSIGPSADGRVKPDVMAQGVSTIVANSSGSTGPSSGTSFSSPVTAGMVACLWQSNPGKKNMEIINAVRESATLYNNPNNQYGYGIPDYCAAKDALLGIKTTGESKHPYISVSPNPFNNEINISTTNINATDVKIQLVDELGRVVYNAYVEADNGLVNNYTIDSGKLNAGLYILKLYTQNNSDYLYYTAKVIKAAN